jgi:ATP-dependent Clp protease ATP-binding subunit ClpC
MFERFTDEARHVVVYAQEEAVALRHPQIGTEHLLLGLLHDETDPTGQAMHAAGLDPAGVRVQLARLVGPARGRVRGHIPFTSRAKQVLENGLRTAQRFDQTHIGRPHLLCGLLEVRDGTAVRVLTELGVDVDGLATTAEELAAPTT